jgi:hypothetical protein
LGPGSGPFNFGPNLLRISVDCMVFSLKGLGFGFSLFWSFGSSVTACYWAAGCMEESFFGR